MINIPSGQLPGRAFVALFQFPVQRRWRTLLPYQKCVLLVWWWNVIVHICGQFARARGALSLLVPRPALAKLVGHVLPAQSIITRSGLGYVIRGTREMLVRARVVSLIWNCLRPNYL